MSEWLQQAADNFNKPLNGSVDYGLKKNPDATAKAQYSARQLEIPYDLAERKSEEINQIQSKRDLLKKLQDTKHVKKAFENPDFAAIAHDDVDALVKIEGVTGKATSLRGPEPTFLSTAKGLGVGFTAGLEKIRQGIRLQWADLIGSERMKNDALRKYEQADLETAIADPEFESSTMRGVYGGLTSITRQAPALLASIYTRNPALVLGYMGQSVEAEAYGKYRGRGATPREAFVGAMGEGAVEVATELMPMGFLVNKFGKVGAGEFLTGIIAREVPSEQVATLVQDAIDTAIANPDKTWGDYVKERPEAAYETLIATLVQSGIVGSANALSYFDSDAGKAETAINEQESLTEIVEAVNESKLKTRSKDELKGFIDNVLGSENEIYIDAETANVFFQDEILKELPDELVENIQESLEMGSDVIMKKSDYLTYLSEHHEELSESLRNDMDGMTAKEANEWVEQGTEQFEREAETILTEMEMESEFRDSADRVAESIKTQIVQTGQSPEVAERYSQLMKNFAITVAEKTNVTPEEALKKIGGLGVAGTVAGDVLEQPVTPPAWETGVDPTDSFLKSADEMGLKAKITLSTQSGSKYIEIEDSVSGELFNLRIADHPITPHALSLHGTPDMEIGKDDETSMLEAFSTAIQKINEARREFKDAELLYQPAFHGTPHKVDKFKTEKIGTGEGAQAFGWGLYFAESKMVGDNYRLSTTIGRNDFASIAKKSMSKHDVNVSDKAQKVFLEFAEKGATVANAKKAQNANIELRGIDVKNLTKAMQTYEKSINRGNLYEVDIPDEKIAQMLDWDAPLSEQPESVRKALRGAWSDPNMTGGEVYNRLARMPGFVGDVKRTENLTGGYSSQDIVSKKLASEFGIPGIKYFDGSSRSAGQGTRNFVVFDENDIEIISRNGEPVSHETTEQFFQSEMGLYSGVEKAIEEMNIPAFSPSKKNPEGKARGQDIWNKLKTSQVKREEVEWLGIEQFLTADPNAKFTREDVLAYAQQNGINIEEVVAEGEKEAEEIEWGDKEVWDDSEAWDWRVDDLINESEEWFDRDSWIEQNIDEIVSNYEGSMSPDAREELMEYDGDPSSQVDIIEKAGYDISELMEDAIREDAEMRAEQEYMDSPIYIQRSADFSDGSELIIFGSDEQGYDVRTGMNYRDVVRSDIWSESEAMIQAEDYARENDLLTDEGDVTTPRWEEYIMDGYAENYREIKLTLPEIEGDFYEEAHFPDRNIVAFLRVNDRQLTIDDRQLSEEELKYEDSPNLQPLRDKLKFFTEEKEKELFDKSKQVVLDAISSRGAEMTELLEKRLNDFSAWESIVNEMGFDGRTASEYRNFLQEKRRITENIVREGERYNTEKAKKQRLGIGDKNAYFIDEFQSDWHQQGRQKGYQTGERDPGDIDAKAQRIVSDITIELKERTINLAEVLDDLEHIDSDLFRYDETELSQSQITNIMFELVRNNFKHSYADETGRKYDAVTKIAEGIEKTDKDWLYGLKDRIGELDKSIKHAEAERYGVPDAPFKGDAWISLGMKRAVVDAVQNNYEAIAFPNAQVLMERWSSSYETLYKNQYDKKMPSILKKLTKQNPVQLTTEGEPVQHEEIGYWIVPITEELKQRVKTEGFPLFQDKRGAFDPSTNIISLLEKADLSTFLHESGHFFFEAYKNIAQESPEIMKDMQTLLDFVEIPDLETWNAMSLEERREGHEKVARAFEAYLFEGKSPSIEMQSLFQTFRDWLLNIYENLMNLNVELTDEVRQVFDRMLATKEQIRAKEVQNSYQPLFESQEEAGMTDKQWVEYQSQDGRRTAISEGELQTRSLRDMKWLSNAKSKALRDIQRDARAKRKAMKSEVTEEVNQEDVYLAKDYIKGFKKQKPVHDNLYTFLRKMGGINVSDDKWLADILKPYNKDGGALPGIAQSEKGVSLDYAAEAATEAGYIELNEGMVDVTALMDILTMEDAGKDSYTPAGLDEQTKLEMDDSDFIALELNAIHGTRFTSGEHLESELAAAPSKRERIETLTDQRMLETYGDLSSPMALERAVEEAVHNEAHTRFLHTELSSLTKKAGVGNVLSRAAKSFAEESISRKKVRDIKPHQYSAAEVRAARNAEKSIIKGDRESAAEHKRAQVLNNHFFRAANNARNDIEKMVRYFKKFNNEGTRKNLDPDYRDQIDQLLENYEFRTRPLKDIDKRKKLVEWVKAQEELGFAPVISEDLSVKNYKEATLEELRGLRDTVKNIEHLARLKNKLLKAKAARELAEAAEIVGESVRNFSTGKNKTKIEHNSWLDRAIEGKREFFAIHRKFASLARQMDGGKDGGPMWEYFIRTMNEAGDVEAVENELATIALEKILRPLKDINKKVYIKEIDNSLSVEGIISIGLNQGNETNRKRIMTGDGWTQEQVDAILDNLTKEHWDVIQSTWDFIDSYWPRIADKEKRVSGLAPEKVERLPVQTKFGEYPGGYYPIKYDSKRSTKAQNQHEAELLKQGYVGKMGQATTRRGHTKQRVDDVKRPVQKDFGVLFQHVGQVIHDLSWHEWLIDTNRLLNRKEIDKAILEGYGPEVMKTIHSTIDDIATGDIPAQHFGERILNHLRTGATVAGIGLNMWTSFLQPLGLSQSMQRIGVKWVGKGMAHWAGDAVRMENTVKNIYDKSSFMRLRAKTQMREINEIRNKVGGKISNVESAYFYFIAKAQQMADVPTWLGAYEKAVYEGNDESRSVALSDQAVLDSQGGGAIKDLSQIQRGGPAWKLFTNFYSYFNVTLNRTAEAFADFRKPSDTGRFMVDMLLIYTLPATFSALMREALKGDCDDEECIVEGVIRENLSYMSGTLVGVREISGVMQGYYGYSGPAGARFFSEISKLISQAEQGEMDKAAWKALNNVAGIVLHYPAGQVQRMVEGFFATVEGDVEGAEIPPALLFGP